MHNFIIIISITGEYNIKFDVTFFFFLSSNTVSSVKFVTVRVIVHYGNFACWVIHVKLVSVFQFSKELLEYSIVT